MVSETGNGPALADDQALVPPAHHHAALAAAETQLRERTRLNVEQTTHVFLRAWAGVLDEIGQYRPYGSDDYQHSIGYRIVLHQLLVVLGDLGHVEALDWLQREVDRLDQVFLDRSVDDVEGLILREEKTHPAYWFMRRLPKDRNVVEHLRMIQPKTPSSETE